MPQAQGFLTGLMLMVLLTGCGRPNVHTFEAQPMEKRLHWTLPAGWSDKYTGDGIRWGSFAGPQGALITVTRFPGRLGDDLGNINRWRTQLGLGEVKDARMDELKSHLTWRTTWIEGDKEVLGGAMTELEGTTLTLKLTAPRPTSADLRSQFTQIIKDIAWE